MSTFQNITDDLIKKIVVTRHMLEETALPYELDGIVIHPELYQELVEEMYHAAYHGMWGRYELHVSGCAVIKSHNVDRYEVQYIIKEKEE